MMASTFIHVPLSRYLYEAALIKMSFGARTRTTLALRLRLSDAGKVMFQAIPWAQHPQGVISVRSSPHCARTLAPFLVKTIPSR